MMVGDEPAALRSSCSLAIPVIVLPLVGFGRAVRRRSRTAQDTLADASAYAAELIGAIRMLQAFTNEALAQSRFGAAVERAFHAARNSTRARAVLTAIVIFLVFAQRRRRAVGRRAGRARRPHHAGHARRSSCSMRCSPPSGLGQLSEVWGELSQASGAAERLIEMLAVRAGDQGAAAADRAARSRRAARSPFDNVRFAYPTRPDAVRCSTACRSRVRQGEKVAIVGPSGAGKSTIFHLLLRFYDPHVRRGHVRRRARRRRRSASHCAAASRWCRRTSWSSPPSSARTSASAGPDASDADVERAARARAARRIHQPAAAEATTRRSASAASRCPAASASASPSRARSCAMRRCCCSTRRPRRSMPRARRWCRPRSSG